MPLPSITRLSDSAYLSLRSLPVSTDGRYDYETAQNSTLAASESHSSFTNFVRKMSVLSDKQYPNVAKAFEGFVDQALHPTAIDDRKGAFEAGLELLSALPPTDPIARRLAIQAVNTLYNTVPHPPAALLGHEHCFRAADGGGNCLEDPNRGRAGTSYARSVQTRFSAPPSSLPDPSLIFDTLLKRRGDRKDHPGGFSSFTFAFATIVTHSVFMTDHIDMSKNNTSSYLDLSPLYGNNEEAQNLVRDKQAGRGLLYPDTFSEHRLMFLPPAASAILVILSRNHNYIAERLLKINERGRWFDPPPPPEDPRRADQDNEIFQTARLINCGHFIGLIIGDYAAGFLGLAEDQKWEIPAFEEMRLRDGKILERGRGNHVSVEFNLLYRWHATLSEPDTEWTRDQFNRAFKGKTFTETKDFVEALKQLARGLEKYPKDRTFSGLKRDTEGRFSDDDIAKILHGATQAPGGAWRARGTPETLRIVEILSIEQARQWGVCTMNEFRQFLGLKQFKSFEEWNKDKDIAEAASQLYGHINNLELYPGLQAEQTMEVKPGSRIAAGYTTVRAVLGDAIAMVRGDRFYTTDFTPANLTAWGYQDCMRDPLNGGFGGEMPKLLMRILPRHYPHNNVFGLFPFFTPKHMFESLKKQGREADYEFERPPTGDSARAPHVINTLEGIRAVTRAVESGAEVGTNIGGGFALGGGFGFGVAGVVKRVWRRPSARKSVAGRPSDNAWALRVMFPNREALPKYRTWFRENAAFKIKHRSWTYDGVPGKYVDIVTGVITSCAVEWAAEHLCGIPLKTDKNKRGLYTEQQMYDKFSLLFRAMFVSEKEPENTFSLRFRANEERKLLTDLIADAIGSIQPGAMPTILSNLVSSIANLLWQTPRRKCKEFLGLLTSSDDPLDKLTAAALGMAVCSAMNVAQAAVLVIDFYLDPLREKECLEIRRLVRADNIADSEELLLGYVREAMRLNPHVSGLFVKATEDVEIPPTERTPAFSVRRGDRVRASYKNAQLNPADFPDPQRIDPMRHPNIYLPTPTYFMGCPGQAFVEQIVVEFVKAVFSLNDVQRAAGYAGKLVGFTTMVNQTEENWYITRTGAADVFPGFIHLVYDL